MPFSKRAVGQSIDRVDGREKLLGRAMFAADHRVADLAYAVVVQAEIPSRWIWRNTRLCERSRWPPTEVVGKAGLSAGSWGSASMPL